LETCLEHRDWDGARRIGHQLKGLAASYGFGEISAFGGALELAIRERRDETNVSELARRLIGLCRSAKTC
jgi:HPt (histidine-containing phosphotransfer) domain-containing protein